MGERKLVRKYERRHSSLIEVATGVALLIFMLLFIVFLSSHKSDKARVMGELDFQDRWFGVPARSEFYSGRPEFGMKSHCGFNGCRGVSAGFNI